MSPSTRSLPLGCSDLESPKVILLAKSEIRPMHVWQVGENRVYRGIGRRENDFASSICCDVLCGDGIGPHPLTKSQCRTTLTMTIVDQKPMAHHAG